MPVQRRCQRIDAGGLFQLFMRFFEIFVGDFCIQPHLFQEDYHHAESQQYLENKIDNRIVGEVVKINLHGLPHGENDEILNEVDHQQRKSHKQYVAAKAADPGLPKRNERRKEKSGKNQRMEVKNEIEI